MTKFKASETQGQYLVEGTVSADEIVTMAKRLLNKRFAKGRAMTEPKSSKDYLTLKLSNFEHEVFSILFLSNNHKIIAYEELFRGTIDAASVYPREVVKRALQLNAAALILAHNHPSGESTPSQSDMQITHKLQQALKMVDIRILDHIIIGSEEPVSLAELGHIT